LYSQIKCEFPRVPALHALLVLCHSFLCHSPQSVHSGHRPADGSDLQMNPAKTELLSKKHNVSLLGCHTPTLQLGLDIATLCNQVRVLGVTISSPWVSTSASRRSFYRLRQLRCTTKSLDNESATTLVYAFMTPRVDYCNAVYAMSPQTITNRLQKGDERGRSKCQWHL